MEFIKLDAEKRKQIIDEAANRKGIPSHAVEKDWWVTQTLRAITLTSASANLIFKGGTSLSKGWGLIERFSEDIDLAIDRKALGIEKEDEEMTHSQITKLRKLSGKYVQETFKSEIEKNLIALGIPSEEFEVVGVVSEVSDVDPQTLLVNYNTLYPASKYLSPKVKIEISARSKMEPNEVVEIRSFISEIFNSEQFADQTFEIRAASPSKTFLEKCMLIHEQLMSQSGKIGEFKSRHLSDIVKLMDTKHGLAAIEDEKLFIEIVEHRKRFNRLKEPMHYENHTHLLIDFIPADDEVSTWEDDYKSLGENMIPGTPMPFKEMFEQLKVVRERFRLKGKPSAGN